MESVKCMKCKSPNTDWKGSSDKKGIYLDKFGCRDCGYTGSGRIYLFDLERWG